MSITLPSGNVDYAPTPSGLMVPTNVRGLKFGTPRDPTRQTLGTLQGAFSQVWLNRRLMPHQQYIADVCGEVLPSGLPAYTLCVITFQRQGGKSALAMAQTGERCFTRPGFHAWYTAQKRKDARDQFLSFADDVVAETPLERVVETLRGNGTEVMKFPRASWLRPHEPSEESLHGKQSDRNDIDEGWAFTKERGDALVQAIGPTQLTRPGAQTYVWSAGGTAASTWLAYLVARGREMFSGYTLNDAGLLVPGAPDARLGGVDVADMTPEQRTANPLAGQRLAYFELGIPDDADPEDLEVVAEHHPAYQYTVSMDSLAALRTTFGDDASGWARAAGNRWTEVIGGSINAAAWQAVRHPDEFPDSEEPRGWGTARAEDGSSTAIVCATYITMKDGERRIGIEVAEVMPGAYAAAERVQGWAQRDPIGVVPDGPSATLADKLTELDHDERVQRLTTREYSAACANMVDALKVRAWMFRPHPALDAAAKIVGKRGVGDGGFVWARLASGASINTMEAATVAVWALTHAAPTGKPESSWS